jgi:hypothetical protein
MTRYVGLVPTAPQSRPGRYTQLDAGQLADLLERSYERDEAPDWELVFELTRRAMSPDESPAERGAVGASSQT